MKRSLSIRVALIALFLLVGCSKNSEKIEVIFSDDFSSSNPAAWHAVSGAWTVVNGQYEQRAVGSSYETNLSSQKNPNSLDASVEAKNPKTLFSDDFNHRKVTRKLWVNQRGSFEVNNGKYVVKSYETALSIPSDKKFNQRSDYRIKTRIQQEPASGAFGAAVLYFRLTMVDRKNDNSYALLLRKRGILDLYKRINGKFSDRLASITVSEDKEPHDVTISVFKHEIKVWFDKSEDEIPDMIVHDSSFTSGTVGLGSYGGVFEFDNIEVLPILKVEAEPSHLYPDGKTSLHLSSGLDFESIRMSVTSPSGKIYGPISPSNCLARSSCSLTFPDAFSIKLTELGTYKISVDNGGESSVLLLEVREKPLFSFVVVSDTHVRDNDTAGDFQDLLDLVSDINQNRHFPRPSFVVITGDLTDNGTAFEMQVAKGIFNQLLVPYYPIIGNHDWVEDLRQGLPRGKNWSDVFGSDKRFYSWTYGDFLFLVEDAATTYNSKQNDSNFINYKTWLRHELAANKNKKVILFCHYGHARIRDDGDAFGYWWGGGNSNDIKDILESSGRVIAEFAGHSHVSGLAKSNGIFYIHTPGFNNMGEYRHVEIYKDRMEVHAVKKSSYRWDLGDAYWQGSTDSTHNVKLYSYGLPIERQFKIDFAAKSVGLLDAISISEKSDWRDYAFQADIRLGKESLVGGNVAGLIFRYQDPSNYYAVLLDSSKNEIRLQKKQKGIVADLAQDRMFIKQEKFYQLRIVAQKNRIRVYVNDVLKIKAADSAFKSGKIGFKSYRANTVYDNVSVAQ